MVEELVVPGDAVEVARRWVGAVATRHFRAAWESMDDNLRLCEAQVWVHAHRDRADIAGRNLDALAAYLARRDTERPLPDGFEDDWLTATAAGLPRWVLEGHRVVATARRQLEGDLDLVVWLNGEEFDTVDLRWRHTDVGPGELLVKVMLTRATRRGWRLAGTGYLLPVPGWPPRSGLPLAMDTVSGAYDR